jgi:hypothetical protein
MVRMGSARLASTCGRGEVRREVFSDGNAIVELANGSLLLLESKSSKALGLAEQFAPYDQPPPRSRSI